MLLLNDVRVFIEIAAAGSLTAAARKLGLPKSSVTRQLDRLESTLTVRLFSRTTRSLALTDEGATFLPHARRLLDDSIEAENVLRRQAAGPSGLVTVSASTTFGRHFLAPHLPEFRRRYPKVRVALRLSAVKFSVGGGQVDVAIRLGPEIESNVARRKLGEIAFCLVAAPTYFRKRPALKEPLDLARVDLIELKPPSVDHRLELYRNGTMQSVRYVPVFEMDDPEAVLATVIAGGGVAALPHFLVAPALAESRLVQVLADWAPPPTPVSVLYDARIAPSLRVGAYVEFVVETLGKAGPWLTGPKVARKGAK